MGHVEELTLHLCTHLEVWKWDLARLNFYLTLGGAGVGGGGWFRVHAFDTI